MKSSSKAQMLAFGSGGLFALAVYLNQEVSRQTSPTFSLLTSYTIGMFFTGLVLLIIRKARPADIRARRPSGLLGKIAGIPGSLAALILSASSAAQLGFANTVSLVILGQVITNIGIDVYGPSGFRRRSLTFHDFGQLCFTMLGIGILLFFSR